MEFGKKYLGNGRCCLLSLLLSFFIFWPSVTKLMGSMTADDLAPPLFYNVWPAVNIIFAFVVVVGG